MPFRLFLSKTFEILNKINTNTCRKSQEHFLAIYFSHKSEIKEFKRHKIALPRQWTYPRGLSLCTRYLFSSMFRRGFRSQFLPKGRHNPTVSELRVLTNEVRTEFSKNAPEIQRQKRLKIGSNRFGQVRHIKFLCRSNLKLAYTYRITR